jgi:hypothetical protein
MPTKVERLSPKVAREYLTKLPASVPWDGTVMVHNSVRPTRKLAERGGFRAWLQVPDLALESCPCGWAAEVGPHFRVRQALD